MSDAERRQCSNCVYFEASTVGSAGTCHHRPPQSCGWPKVSVSDWCGEFLRRPNKAMRDADVPRENNW